MLTVLIIGAGFSGVVTAVQLMRRAGKGGLRVILLNRSGSMARGLAYGTRSPGHLLNVPAGNMSALADEPDHFLRYAQGVDARIGAASFVARQLYGDYLESLLASEEQACGRQVVLERITGEVCSLTPGRGHARARARAVLADGRLLEVDRVVLAFGHFPSSEPRIADPRFYRSAHYVRDPWDTQAIERIAPAAPVLLLGSGLTAIDLATTLLDASPTRPVHLVSRHGLLPQAHRSGPLPAQAWPLPAPFASEAGTVRAMLQAFRAQAGADWRDALNALRPVTQSLWQRLGDAERRRFLRHVQPYWDNHRHRAAPAAHARFQAAIDAGTVHVHAGRIVACTVQDGQVQVRIRPRGGAAEVDLAAHHVINCIGPCPDLNKVASPLVEQLLRDRMIRPDALSLGIDVAPDCAVMDAGRRPSDWLFYVGPLLKAHYWEATAVPELRRFAARLAATLLA